MADTAPKIAAEERFESPFEVDLKAQKLADQIRKSKHFIAFTGAGISTSAGIPDFRGPEGSWTLLAQGRQRTKEINTLTAIPTPTHMALVALQDRGILKFLVSQNCDGLHRRSGILPDRIAELHGNSNREYCKDCGKEYIRDFRAVATYEKTVHNHRTGRRCAICSGILLDSIVNFGDFLPADHLENARSNARKADLCLVLGSSLTVPPASTIPEIVGKKKATKNIPGGKLVVCNLQETPLDHLSKNLRIYAKSDDLMVKVMDKLGIEIPEFMLRRNLVVELETREERHTLVVRGVDVDGTTPATFLRSVKLEYNRRVVRAEPFVINFRGALDPGTELKLELEFMGHYGEPNLDIVYEVPNKGNGQSRYLFEYNPQNGEWKTTKQDDMPADIVMHDNAADNQIRTIDLTEDDDMVPDRVRHRPAARALPVIA